jgi:hypothetical protein
MEPDYLLETEVEKPKEREILLEGKLFKYKTTTRKLPHGWFDLEISNREGKSIIVYFNPKRQNIIKEIRRWARFHKWI